MKQIATRIQAMPVYRDGDREWSEQFPVSVYEDGEGALSMETALLWETRHKHYLELARRGELPEPTAYAPRNDDDAPSGPPRVIETRIERVTVHEEGDHVWEEQFPAVVYSDGHVTFDIAIAHKIEARRARYAELAERGELPKPTGHARPKPPPPQAPCVVGTRTQPVPVYQEGDRLWEEAFPVVVYEDGAVALEAEALPAWEARNAHYRDLAERGELPEPSGTAPADSHEAAGA